ncbi:MAG: thermonuclease family protein [Bauldia sp.]
MIVVAVAAVQVVAGSVVVVGKGRACATDHDGTTVTIAEAIDGATIGLADGGLVRLAGIEAPERPLGMPESRSWPLALVARQGLERLAVGKDAVVDQIGSGPDRHGRMHANVYLGETRQWLQSTLVVAGLARVHWLPGDPPCIAALLDAEEAARARGLGIWSSPDYAVRQANDPSLLARKGLYELVEGRVTSIGHGTSMIFVDFGREYRSDFTIMVSLRVAGRLSEGGISIDGLKGRRVRVRGVIEESGGPAIRLNDPVEIEVLADGDEAGGRG